MIDYVYGGEYMSVTSHKGSTPYVNTSNPITGMVAYDSSSQGMKVYDGSTWMTLGGGVANIHLTPQAISILKWAEQKMLEEAERNKLAETNPTIKDLMNQIKEKEEQINIVQSLVKEEVKV
jgi:uncharacterized spore protein YtfJ